MDDAQAQPTGNKTQIASPPGIASVAILPPTQPDTTPAGAEEKSQPAGDTTTAVTYKFASDSHDYIREYIRNADQKAIFYFSICSALLAFEHIQSWSTRWTKSPIGWSMVDFASFIAMSGLALAAACFLFTVMPRLGGSPRGLIFFKAIANYPSADLYISDIVKQQERELAAEKLRHCYELSKVASSKYAAVAYGFRIGAIAILCSLVLLVGVSPKTDGSKQIPAASTRQ